MRCSADSAAQRERGDCLPQDRAETWHSTGQSIRLLLNSFASTKRYSAAQWKQVRQLPRDLQANSQTGWLTLLRTVGTTLWTRLCEAPLPGSRVGKTHQLAACLEIYELAGVFKDSRGDVLASLVPTYKALAGSQPAEWKKGTYL